LGSMEVLAAQIIALVLIVVVGGAPIALGHRFGLTTGEAEIGNRRARARVLAFLMNFGGGVLVGLSLCHWLPETRETIESFEFNTELPVTEILMVTGLLLIFALEVVVHKLLTPWLLGRHQSSGDGKDVWASIAEAEGSKHGYGALDDLDPKDSASMREKKILSAIRTFFVMLALCFHAVMDGIALSLQKGVSNVWVSFGAIFLHKIVLAASIGIETMSAGLSRLNSFIAMGVFAGSPALGFVIGYFIYDSTTEGESSSVAVEVVMALAAGTILYVVFFEIVPRAKEVGATGVEQVVAMTAGFAVFLPTMLLHEPHND